MVPTAVASQTVLVVTAGLLLWITAVDLRQFKIRNELILVLAGLFFLHAILSGRWVSLHWDLGFAALMSALMLFAYLRGWMGGGDVKLLAVAFLWSGVHCVVLFLLALVVFALLHALAARLGWVGAQGDGGRLRIPFAPSVAASLIVVFMSGCLSLVGPLAAVNPHLHNAALTIIG